MVSSPIGGQKAAAAGAETWLAAFCLFHRQARRPQAAIMRAAMPDVLDCIMR